MNRSEQLQCTVNELEAVGSELEMQKIKNDALQFRLGMAEGRLKQKEAEVKMLVGFVGWCTAIADTSEEPKDNPPYKVIGNYARETLRDWENIRDMYKQPERRSNER